MALCTYNGAQYLAEQLDSILNQTMSVDEIVVCDDGSTDATLDILEAYKQKTPDILRIYRNEKNLRSVKNFEKAINLCTGDLIFLSDQDDLWLSRKVEVIVNYFKEHPNITAVATNGFGIDSKGQRLDCYSVWDMPRFLKEQNIPVDYFKILTLSGNFATGASMAFKKGFVKKIIPFPVLPDYHHDEWIAINAAEQGTFAFIDEKLFCYREHERQQVGGVFFEKIEKEKQAITHNYNVELADQSFQSYKRLLKRISLSANKYDALFQQPEYAEFSLKIKRSIINTFTQLKSEMKLRYPIRASLLFFTDKILKKRQLKI